MRLRKIHFIILLVPIFQIMGCTSQTKHSATEKEGIGTPVLLVNETVVSKRSSLLVSKDFGETWIDASHGLPPEVQISFIDKLGNNLLIATDNMGLFLSSNHKTRWKQIGANLTNQKINALHVRENTIFVGVFGSGIFKSDDNGSSWTSVNYNLPNINVQTIWQLEEQLFVGTDAGIFRLKQNSKSWESTDVITQVLSLYEHDAVLVAGTSQGSVISKDKGNSWNWVRKEGAVHYTHNIGKTIIELGLNGDLFFSEDWGETWLESKYEPREWAYIYEITKVGEYLVMSNNYGIHRSADNGRNWELIYPTESMVFFDFLVIGNEIYAGTRAWDEYRKRNEPSPVYDFFKAEDDC